MTTALQIITRAMQKSGILTKSESPAADESSDALDALNDILSSWSNDSLCIYARVTESFTLSGGTASYTIGTSQTFNTVRPIFIAEAHIRQSTTDYPVEVISDEIYQGITDKAISRGIPFWLNYTNAFPAATINLYPIPSSALTLYITSEKELTQFSTLATVVSLPPGWKKALIDALAVELSPEYGQQITPAMVAAAKESKGSIMRAVLKTRGMDALPTGNIGRFNIYRGY